jgi:DNA-binding beta-propeller fold protein YncE
VGLRFEGYIELPEHRGRGGEDTVAMFDARHPNPLVTVPVGRGPNGLAFDPARRTLPVANVGDPVDPRPGTLSMVDPDQRVLSASISVAGRTRWTVFDPVSDRFSVNIAGAPHVIILDPTLHQLYAAVGNPGLIEVFDSRELEPIGTVVTEPGAHTIGIDLDHHRVYAFLPATHRAAVFAARA